MTPSPFGFWVQLICCGRDDGIYFVRDYARAEELRESYTSGPGVNPRGYSAEKHESGHKRAAIVSEAVGWPNSLPERYFPPDYPKTAPSFEVQP